MRLMELYEQLRVLYPSLSNRELKELAIKQFERFRNGEMIVN